MKLSISQNNVSSPLNGETLNSIFPLYGTVAPDVPVFDPDKHMYIVDQHTSVAGHRSITYVAIGGQLLIEVILGLFHCWTIMNTIRLLVFDGTTLKVVMIHEWKGTNYYNPIALRETITELIARYVLANLEFVGQQATEEIVAQARSLVASMLELSIGDHARNNLLRVLKAYCSQMNLCLDYVTK